MLSICLAHTALSQTNIVWRPGETIPQKVAPANYNRFFGIEEIGEATFERIYQKSYKADCTTKRSDLRYLRLLHTNKEGNTQMGELICHKSIASDLLCIFKKLYEADYRIERMVLVDEYDADDEASMSANNTSCFNFRKVSGSNTLSKHSLGLAIDINPLINPYVHTKTGKIEPPNGKPYAYRRTNTAKQPLHFINRNDLCYKLFIAHGFRWGGAWKTNIDYQHFEKPLS